MNINPTFTLAIFLKLLKYMNKGGKFLKKIKIIIKNIRTNIKINIRQFALRLQGPKLFNSLPKLLEVSY